MLLDDTIVAVSTPAGASPVAIVRLSGPKAFAIVEGLLEPPRRALGPLPPYSAREVAVRLRPDGPRVPASLYVMRGPRSYTREDVAEVHTVGSVPLVRALLDACLRRGARLAEPGEFTRRAFLAGRISLAQAEGVLAVIQAATASELRAGLRALDGEPTRQIRRLHESLLALRARAEASIDFAQQGIELLARDDLLAAIQAALDRVDHELANADAGAVPPEGIRVALCGLPNAGKSSLFNALLERPRTIVTDIPGTTRDAVAEPLSLGGVRFRLYDTAGLFGGAARQGLADAESADAQAGARARGLVAGAHIAGVVVDGSRPLTDAERRLWAEIRAPHKLLLLHKADLGHAVLDAEGARLAGGAPVLRTSAVTREGLAEVAERLVAAVRTGQVDVSPSDVAWNARHREAFRQARRALRRARRAAREGLGMEFVAADLREAHDALGGITGDVVAEDILDVVFAEFCVGK